jgi:hypothetical protein
VLPPDFTRSKECRAVKRARPNRIRTHNASV